MTSTTQRSEPELPALRVQNLLDTADSLFQRGERGKAVALTEQAGDLLEHRRGGGDPKLLLRQRRMRCDFRRSCGSYRASLASGRAAVQCGERLLDPNDPELARVRTSLAATCKHFGLHDEGVDHCHRALAGVETALPAKQNLVGSIYQELGALQLCRGRRDQAAPLARRGLHLREVALGPDDPSIARGLVNLGLIVEHLGDLEEAEALYRRAHDIWSRLPEFGQGLGHCLHGLASIAQRRSDWELARALYDQSLAAKLEEFGPLHPSLGPTLNNIALVERCDGQESAARGLLREALTVLEQEFEPTDARVRACEDNLRCGAATALFAWP